MVRAASMGDARASTGETSAGFVALVEGTLTVGFAVEKASEEAPYAAAVGMAGATGKTIRYAEMHGAGSLSAGSFFFQSF